MPNPIRPGYWPGNGQPERTEPFTRVVGHVIAASWWPPPYVFDLYREHRIRAVFSGCWFDNRKDMPGEAPSPQR